MASQPLTAREWMREIPQNHWDDEAWARDHYADLTARYPDQWVIVHQRQVIAAHKDLGVAEKLAMDRLDGEMPTIVFADGGARVYY